MKNYIAPIVEKWPYRVATHTGKTGKYLKILGKKNWYLIILENFKFQPFSSIILEKALRYT